MPDLPVSGFPVPGRPELTCPESEPRPAISDHAEPEDDDWPDDERDCTRCGGEPYMVECDDPIQCCKPGCDGVNHGCDACNDTGLRRNQWSF